MDSASRPVADADADTDGMVAALASPEPLIAAWARLRFRVMRAYAAGHDDPWGVATAWAMYGQA
jgi:hypothetical protein